MLSPSQVLQQRPGNRTGSSQVGFGHSFFMFLHWTRATILRFFWTATHSHRRQYMMPKGGPKSANQVEPNSFNCFPNWHSGMSKKYALIRFGVISRFQKSNLVRQNNTWRHLDFAFCFFRLIVKSYNRLKFDLKFRLIGIYTGPR